MNSTEWFVDWFDTEYYHQLYKIRDDKEAQLFIAKLLDFLKLAPSSTVLDLACGKGRHSRTLASYGFDVTGVDLSANSIQSAQEFEQANLRFAVQDMREPLNQKFDVVFNLFTSFGYFDSQEDNSKVIQAVHSMLNPDGIFVIDFMNAFRIAKNLVPNEVKTIDDVEYRIQREFTGEHIIKDIEVVDGQKRFKFSERVQYLIENDFRTLLSSNGFEVLEIFGNFNLESFHQDNSDRLIIIAKKTK